MIVNPPLTSNFPVYINNLDTSINLNRSELLLKWFEIVAVNRNGLGDIPKTNVCINFQQFSYRNLLTIGILRHPCPQERHLLNEKSFLYKLSQHFHSIRIWLWYSEWAQSDCDPLLNNHSTISPSCLWLMHRILGEVLWCYLILLWQPDVV